jgi:HK97 gp10 family phage protein
MKVHVRVTKNDIPAIAARLPDAVARIVNQNLLEAADRAITLVPVRTGRLRDSINSRMTGRTTGSISADTPYAAYVEYGTRFMAARPFLRPAMEQQRPRYLADLADLERRLG